LGRASKAEWTRDDTARALAQGWGLFTAKGSKVMRVHRIDGEPVSGINLKPRSVFGNDEAARAGSSSNRPQAPICTVGALDGRTGRCKIENAPLTGDSPLRRKVSGPSARNES
jgi:hypothetical protein